LTTGSSFAERYKVIEELGQGGMGKVYRVLDTKIDEQVALKVLNTEVATDKKTIERFRNELKLARKISHKNVCRMFHLSEEEGTTYITMEYVSGEDLKSFIRRTEKLTSGKAISIAMQICDGLSEAHKLGVVHRDLKPQNIMIDREGNAKIMDFGIARTLKGSGITGEGVVIGTPDYMSPEQVDAKEIDQRSDIYSLGVILFEMTTGQVPFAGDTPLSVAVKHKTESPPEPKNLNSHISDDLNTLILKCLAKDRETRFESAEELFSELENIEKGIPVTERIIPKRKPITSREITVTLGLKRILLPVLIIVTLTIIAVLIWKLLPQKRGIAVSKDKPSLTILPFVNNTGDESHDHWRTALSELLIDDLFQSKYIYVVPKDRLYTILRKLNILDVDSYTSEDFENLASWGISGHILIGSYFKSGEVWRINVTLQSSETGEVIGKGTEEAQGAQPAFEMVDRLTTKVKNLLQLTEAEMASDIDVAIDEITTSSPEAYRYFSEGTKYYFGGNPRSAIPLLEKAVETDPEFALAYRNLAATYANIGRNDEFLKYIKKAFDLSDKLPDRERLIIQSGYYFGSESDYDKTFEMASKLIDLYPDDLFGHRYLGLVYSVSGELEKATEHIRLNTQNFPENAQEQYNLCAHLMEQGSLAEVEQSAKDFLDMFPENAIVRWPLIATYIHLGKFDLALEELDRLLHLDPGQLNRCTWTKGQIYTLQGDFERAEQEYEKLLASDESPSVGIGIMSLAALQFTRGMAEKATNLFKDLIEWTKKMKLRSWESSVHSNYLAYVYIQKENPTEALKECDEAWRIATDISSLEDQKDALFHKTWAFLEMKSLDDAKKTAHELKKLLEKERNKRAMCRYHLIEGLIALEEEDWERAIESCTRALSLSPQYLLPIQKNDRAMYLEPLALAHYKLGDLDKAQAEYEKIAALTLNRIENGDIYAKSFYMLGKIFEKKGQRDEAIVNYEKFVELWKDCDPQFQSMVQDSRERIESLKRP
jgi:serine/threonine protein kinase/Tfp pilus assembly protein PilF